MQDRPPCHTVACEVLRSTAAERVKLETCPPPKEKTPLCPLTSGHSHRAPASAPARRGAVPRGTWQRSSQVPVKEEGRESSPWSTCWWADPSPACATPSKEHRPPRPPSELPALLSPSVDTMAWVEVVEGGAPETDGVMEAASGSPSLGRKRTRPSRRLAMVASTQFVWAERKRSPRDLSGDSHPPLETPQQTPCNQPQ